MDELYKVKKSEYIYADISLDLKTLILCDKYGKIVI